MSKELGYEVTPKQSLDGLWRTMLKYIEQHGDSDISLELEGAQYEFRQHLQKYDEYEAKAKAFDYIVATYENNTGLGENDEDLTDFEAIVDSIEHGIQMVGHRENEEDK